MRRHLAMAGAAALLALMLIAQSVPALVASAQQAEPEFRVYLVAPSLAYPGENLSMTLYSFYNGTPTPEGARVVALVWVGLSYSNQTEKSSYNLTLPPPIPISPGVYVASWRVPYNASLGSTVTVHVAASYQGYTYDSVSAVTIVPVSLLVSGAGSQSTGVQTSQKVSLADGALSFLLMISVVSAVVLFYSRNRGSGGGAQIPQATNFPYLEHIAELTRRFMIALVVTALFFVLFFWFRPVWVNLGRGLYLFYPSPDPFSSFSAQAFGALKNHILPSQITLINIDTFDTIAVSLKISLVFSLIFSMPVWVYEAMAFVSPALKSNEKRLLRAIALPATALFALGVAFAYEIILPLVFRFILFFAQGLNVVPTLSVNSFVSIVIIYLVVFGLAFEMPVVVGGLSYVGLVKPESWLRYWRYAVAVSFFIALLISPGTSGGLIEVTIGLTLSALYVSGALFVKYLVRGTKVEA